jgi:hypothetical protein
MNDKQARFDAACNVGDLETMYRLLPVVDLKLGCEIDQRSHVTHYYSTNALCIISSSPCLSDNVRLLSVVLIARYLFTPTAPEGLRLPVACLALPNILAFMDFVTEVEHRIPLADKKDIAASLRVLLPSCLSNIVEGYLWPQTELELLHHALVLFQPRTGGNSTRRTKKTTL